MNSQYAQSSQEELTALRARQQLLQQQLDANRSMHAPPNQTYGQSAGGTQGSSQRMATDPLDDLFHPDHPGNQQTSDTNENGKRRNMEVDSEGQAPAEPNTPRPPRTAARPHSRATSVASASRNEEGRPQSKVGRGDDDEPDEDGDHPTDDMDDDDGPPDAPEEDQDAEALKASRQEKRNRIRELMAGKDQADNDGAISFPRQTLARCNRSTNFRPPYIRNDATCDLMADAFDEGGAVIWAQAHLSAKITKADAELFRWGLLEIEKRKLVTDFVVSDYKMPTPPRDAKAILIITSNQEATRRILERKVLTFRSPDKAGTFFVQSNESWGSHIIVDIKGGGTDFERDVLPHVWVTFGPYVQLAQGKKKKKAESPLADFAYHKVPFSEKTHGDTKVVTWRVKFKYTSLAMDPNWVLPTKVGKSSRGDIECAKAPFCSHCVSYSHAQPTCEWWKENHVAGKKTRPKNYQKVEWQKITSVNPSQLIRAAV
ncbi:hypothetical protein FRC00_000041 [Tulasnella sp. 408]|nr:hypothetical protein FRC00_000041 [Tulasnella sp. 408]